jgi:purine-binding chemotaxis protein CheW
MTDYVTFTSGSQLFGLPIDRIQDVFAVGKITRVPLAASEIEGVLNLRGRIITVINLANRLQLSSSSDTMERMVIGVEVGAESFGILVDNVGEVLALADQDREPIPTNLGRSLSSMTAGIFRLDQQLLVVLDADRILDLRSRADAA